MVKESFSTNSVGTFGYPYGKKNEHITLLTPYYTSELIQGGLQT